MFDIGMLAVKGANSYLNATHDTRCQINLKNETEINLIHIRTNGNIEKQFVPNVLPGKTESMVAIKKMSPSQGTDGSVAFEIGDRGPVFFIVWHVPFFTIFDGNKLKLGTCEKNQLGELKSFKDFKNSHLEYFESDNKETVENLTLVIGEIQITASMSTTRNANVVVVVSCIKEQELESVTSQEPETITYEQLTKSENTGNGIECCNLHNLMPSERRIVGGIRIENKTCFSLVDPRCRADKGVIQIKPSGLAAFESGVVVVHNNPFKPTGCYGTLSYYIKEKDCRIVLMWSLPFNHVFFSNKLAVDIRKGKKNSHNRELFDMMYYERGIIKAEYKHYSSEISFQIKGVKVSASMGTSHWTQINLAIQTTEAYKEKKESTEK